MSKRKASAPDESPQDFESQLKELEGLVEKLESGDLSLDDSLAHYRRGVELARGCQQHLEKARLTIEELAEVDDESSARALDDED